MRFMKKACLRALMVCGFVAAVAPATPTAAQPGASTPANCVIQLSVANPTPGDLQIPRSLVMSGTAVDDTSTSGSGISDVQVFLGNRDLGGLFLGSTTVNQAAPGTWSLTTSIPDNLNGGQNLFVYGTSAVSGLQAFVSIPFAIAPTQPNLTPPSDQAGSFCPANVAAPTAVPTVAPPPLVPTVVPTVQPAAPTPQPTAQAAPTQAAVPPQVMPLQLAIGTLVSPPIGFDTDTLAAVAGAQVTVTFTNNTPGQPHNWHLFDGADSSAASLAQTQILVGPDTSDTVSFMAPTQPGNYFFWCDVHRNLMTGTFVASS